MPHYDLHLKPSFIYALALGLVSGGIWVGTIKVQNAAVAESVKAHIGKDVHGGGDVRLSVIETQVKHLVEQQAEIKRETKEDLSEIKAALTRLWRRPRSIRQ